MLDWAGERWRCAACGGDAWEAVGMVVPDGPGQSGRCPFEHVEERGCRHDPVLLLAVSMSRLLSVEPRCWHAGAQRPGADAGYDGRLRYQSRIWAPSQTRTSGLDMTYSKVSRTYLVRWGDPMM